MYLQCILVPKALLANVARVRFFTSVDHFVLLIVLLQPECFLAYFTFIFSYDLVSSTASLHRGVKRRSKFALSYSYIFLYRIL